MLKQKLKHRFGYKRLTWITFGAILVCVFNYFLINIICYMDKERESETEGYFVNTSGCCMLALNPNATPLLKYFRQVESRKCSKLQLFRGETVRDTNFLELAMSEREIVKTYGVESITEVNCTYKLVRRHNDFSNKMTKGRTFFLSNQKPLIKVEDGSRILRIQCFVPKRKLIYHDVHFFLPAAPPPRSIPSTSSPNRLSVMILGIDSISHMHFLRMMPSTAAFIRHLSHVEFWGYNRVGVNSFPNLVPLLSGLSDTEMEGSCYKNKSSFDECKFLWNHFKAAGYNTSFGEDNMAIGTFSYCKKGFAQQPTDFYLRPVMAEIDCYTRYSLDELDLIHCSAGRKYADIHHEFIYKLIPHMNSGDHFSIFWETQGVHDYYNYARVLDERYLCLLQRLHEKSVLENTLVLFMSDHGLRFGSFRRTWQGMYEESLPFLIALYPKWLEKAYPAAISNLRYNSHSLVTAFDLHVTLKDLTNLKLLRSSNIANRSAVLKGLGQKIPRGISLFLPIPELRDCKLAHIPANLCNCHKLKKIRTSAKVSQRAARFVVDSINMLIKSHRLCQKLYLEEVQEAYVLKKGADKHFEVKVRLQTSPGEGLFEGTTRFTEDSLALNGAITRTNRYGNQSYCVNDHHIEMFCYCL
ncbi:uncharacterized protein [Drosophila virilis]|nr:uncharacterized protein LOC6629135 [Drosophila virilis]